MESRRGFSRLLPSLFLSFFLSFALSKPIHIQQSVSPSLSFTFFHISDVHLDPYSNPILYNTTTFCRPPAFFEDRIDDEDTHLKHSSKFDKELTGEVPNYFGRYGCDTNEALFNSTLEAMVKTQPHPDFIIFTGDSPAHKLTAIEQVDMIQYVAEALNTSFPGVLVIPAIGNNDVYPDYNLTCNDTKLPGLFNIYKSWIPASQESTYLQMGAFAVSPLPGLLVLSLNTIIYSVRNSNGSRSDPCGQFAWLTDQLEDAKAQGLTVYIIGHIIPGMDPNLYTPLWNPNYVSDFVNIILSYTDVIGGMLFGHVHKDEFRMLSVPPIESKAGQAQQSSIVTASSFSPVYDNNPSFRLYSYDKTYTLLDYDTIYMDLYMANMNGFANWTLEYSYSDYGVGPIATSSLEALLTKMQNNPFLFSNWYDRQVAQYQASKQAALCVISAPDSTDFSTCMSQGTK